MAASINSQFALPNGNIYKGQVLEDQPHGHGTMIDFIQKAKIVGTFAHGVLIATIKSTNFTELDDGAQYLGDLDDNQKMTGRGKWIDPVTKHQITSNFENGKGSSGEVKCKNLITGEVKRWNMSGDRQTNWQYLGYLYKNASRSEIPSEWMTPDPMSD